MHRMRRILLALIVGMGLLVPGIATCDGLRGVTCAGDDPGCDASLYLIQFLAAFRINYYPTHLYVTDSTNVIRAYSVDRATGDLAAGAVFGSGNLSELEIRSAGNALYVSSNASPTGLFGYALEPDPANPTAISGSPFATTAYANLSMNDSGTLIYAAIQGATGVTGYQVDPATGSLTTISGSPFGAVCVSAVAFNRQSTYLYASNASGVMSRYPVDQTTGALGTRVDQSFLTANSMSFSDDDQFYYQTINGASATNVVVAAWNAADGSLTHVSGSPFPLGASNQSATGIAVDSRRRRAYVLNSTASQIQTFNLDATTGVATQGGVAPATTGASPAVVKVAPGDDFVYVGNGSAIQIYSVDRTSGALTEVGSVTGLGAVRDMVFRQQSEPAF
jgi:6-phosphogluconolactonase (cycloisomerase 2 family)